MSGFVYVATNESLDGVVKIGISTDPVSRIRKLKSTGVPTSFSLAWAHMFKKPEVIEAAFQEYFRECRVANDREFFKMSVEEATEYLNNKVFHDNGNVERFDILCTMQDEISDALNKASLRGVSVPDMAFVLGTLCISLMTGGDE